MSGKLTFVDLGAHGLDYVREHLTGVNPFCTALLAVVDAAPGKVLTLAPEGVDLERLQLFSEGGLLTAQLAPARVVRIEDGGTVASVTSLKVEQAAYLISIMQTTPDSVCIVDDFDPPWSEAQSFGYENAFGVANDTYHLFRGGDAPSNFVQALRDGDTIWHGVAAVCADAPELDDDREATIDALEAAAASALVITCTAYDGEGFVVWRRK